MREADADEELMLRYAGGDARAFELLYERHRGGLWRFVRQLLRDPQAAEDAFQEAWSRVIAHRKRYRPTARFASWLYRIAHNCCMDHWRSTGRRRAREVADPVAVDSAADPAAGPHRAAAAQQAAQALAAAVARLPLEQRATFLLYVQGGLSVAEIADQTGCGPETAKSRLRYAVAKLKEALGPQAPADD